MPREQLSAGLRWHGSGGWHAALDAFAIGAVVVDDANSAHAPGYATLGFDAGRVVRHGIMTIAPFVRIDNLFDRRYIGSVIVNGGNGRYYEPAPGRSVMVGVKVRFDE